MKIPMICLLHEKKHGYIPMGTCVICDKPTFISIRGLAGEISIQQINALPVKPKFIGRECMIDMVFTFGALVEADPELREVAKQRLLKEEYKIKP